MFLAETSKIITDVIDEHDKIEDELKTAKALTRNLRMREFADRFLLGLAFLFYASVCIFIIVSRLKWPLNFLFGWMFAGSGKVEPQPDFRSAAGAPLPPNPLGKEL